MRANGLFRGAAAPPGQFRLQQPAQDAAAAAIGNTMSGLIDDSVIGRLRGVADTDRYFAGDIVAQKFTRPPLDGGVNTESQLELAPVQLNARQALNRNRGFTQL